MIRSEKKYQITLERITYFQRLVTKLREVEENRTTIGPLLAVTWPNLNG